MYAADAAAAADEDDGRDGGVGVDGMGCHLNRRVRRPSSRSMPRDCRRRGERRGGGDGGEDNDDEDEEHDGGDDDDEDDGGDGGSPAADAISAVGKQAAPGRRCAHA